jgi:hypothetical protein
MSGGLGLCQFVWRTKYLRSPSGQARRFPPMALWPSLFDRAFYQERRERIDARQDLTSCLLAACGWLRGGGQTSFLSDKHAGTP